MTNPRGTLPSFPAFLSSISAPGFGRKNPSTGDSSQPPTMDDEEHTVFSPVYIHTAKCDNCEGRNTSVLQRCIICAAQLCYRCMLGGGTHKLNSELDWTDYGAQAGSFLKKPTKNNTDLKQSTARQSYSKITSAPSTISKTRQAQPKRVQELTEEAMGTTTLNQVPIMMMAEIESRKISSASDSEPKKVRSGLVVPGNNSKDSNNTRPAIRLVQRGQHKDSNIKGRNQRRTAQSKNKNLAATRRKIPSKTQDADNDTEVEEEHYSNKMDETTSVFRGTSQNNHSLIQTFNTTKPSKGKHAVPVEGEDLEAMESIEHDMGEELYQINKEMSLLKERQKLVLAKQREMDEVRNAAIILMSMSR